jgi:hypothetical protein
LPIHGKLAVVAVRAQIPGTRQFHFTQNGKNASRAQLTEVGLAAARTEDVALIGGRLRELQQMTEGDCAGLMQGGTEGHLHRFQIQLTGLLALGEDATQQHGHFACDLGLDRRGRFFSSGVNVSSTGRNAQIFSLTSTTSALSF